MNNSELTNLVRSAFSEIIGMPIESMPDVPLAVLDAIQPKLPAIEDYVANQSTSFNFEDVSNAVRDVYEQLKSGQCAPHEDAGHKSIAIDFDNTVLGESGEPVPGALEALAKLKNDGWRVFIHSSALNNPARVEEIRNFFLSNGIEIDSFIPKPEAQFYVDDKAISFDGSWDKVLAKVQTGKQAITASAIKQGYHSVKDVAAYLGINPDEFYGDVAAIYSCTSENDFNVVTARLNNKYGLVLNAAVAKNTGDAYIRECLAKFVEASTERIKIGSIVCSKGLQHYGSVGKVIAEANGELVIDAEDYGIEAPFSLPETDVVLAPRYKSASARGHILYAVAPNAAYPDGLSFDVVSDYYDKHFPWKEIRGSKVKKIYKLAHALVPAVCPTSEVVVTTLDMSTPALGLSYACGEGITAIKCVANSNLGVSDIKQIASDMLTAGYDTRITASAHDTFHITISGIETSELHSRLASIKANYPELNAKICTNAADIIPVPNSLDIDTGDIVTPVAF